VQILGNGEGRGAVTSAWLLVSCAGLWHLSRLLHVPVALRWVGIAAFACMPLLYAQVAGMQTELPAIGVALALAVVIAAGHRPGRRIAVVAALAGLALSLKLSNASLLLPMGLWLLLRMRRDVAPGALVRACFLAVLVGGSSYAHAWWIAGNPALPMMNALFRSPDAPFVNKVDERWQAGDWDLPWALMFETERFVEAANGAGGMLMFLMMAGSALALAVPRARAIVIVTWIACASMFAAMHYLRYLLPALAVLWPAVLAGLSWLRLHREACVAVGLLALANAWLMPTGTWIANHGALRDSLLRGRDVVFERFAPHRALAQQLRERYPSLRTLVIDSVHLSELAGHAYTTAWVDTRLAKASADADGDPTGRLWRALLLRLDVDLVAIETTATPVLQAALSSLSARNWKP
jgi:hypothetical protein